MVVVIWVVVIFVLMSIFVLVWVGIFVGVFVRVCIDVFVWVLVSIFVSISVRIFLVLVLVLLRLVLVLGLSWDNPLIWDNDAALVLCSGANNDVGSGNPAAVADAFVVGDSVDLGVGVVLVVPALVGALLLVRRAPLVHVVVTSGRIQDAWRGPVEERRAVVRCASIRSKREKKQCTQFDIHVSSLN